MAHLKSLDAISRAEQESGLSYSLSLFLSIYIHVSIDCIHLDPHQIITADPLPPFPHFPVYLLLSYCPLCSLSQRRREKKRGILQHSEHRKKQNEPGGQLAQVELNSRGRAEDGLRVPYESFMRDT